jgi:hypothetical protein
MHHGSEDLGAGMLIGRLGGCLVREVPGPEPEFVFEERLRLIAVLAGAEI